MKTTDDSFTIKSLPSGNLDLQIGGQITSPQKCPNGHVGWNGFRILDSPATSMYPRETPDAGA